MSTPAQAKDRVQAGSLAEEQAALRRVATLVAGGAPAAEVFEAVAREVAQVMHSANAAVTRFDDDGATMTILAAWDDRPHGFQPGTSWPLDGRSMSAKVLSTGRPARVEDYTDLPGSLAAEARRSGLTTIVGAPIIVDGRIWGLMAISSREAPLPDHVEDRLAEFTDLVATAIANSQAREDLTRLAEEQAAQRRVATLVAQGAAPAAVFAAVSAEVARLVPADGAALTRFEDDGTVTVLGGWTRSGGYVYVGTRYALEGTVSGLVFEARRPSRIDNYAGEPGAAAAAGLEMGWRSSVGAPITVEGRLWGVLAVASTSDRPLPPDTERRLVEFTELVATAVANAESREELTRLAEEQAALRRVATLVAQGAPPAEVFQTVSAEVGRLVPADSAAVSRYETDGTVTILGIWTAAGIAAIHPGERFALDPATTSGRIFATRRPARVHGVVGLSDDAAAAVRRVGWRSIVGAPILVEGRLWGVINVASTTDEALPSDTEARLAEFTELLATAIANAESRAELEASRARIVATADATRRRIERDLHDGAQQRLVSLALEVRAAQASVPPELGELRAELSRVAEGHRGVLDELREIAQGIHPANLAESGLGPALKMLARRSPIPVELDLQAETRLPDQVEVAAYYVVSEALTNAAKYSRATVVHVHVKRRDDLLRVAVRDDGLGGADPALGSGLLGLKDRAEAIGGTISLESPPGAGTSLLVELPVDEPIA
jgi:signal transduction histidine kinase